MTRTRMLFSLEGRLPRRHFVIAGAIVVLVFVSSLLVLDQTLGRRATIPLYPVFYWICLALGVKRYHDLSKSGAWLGLLAIPILGPLWVGIELSFRRGTPGENRYGPEPIYAGLAHLEVSSDPKRPLVINDVTQLNPIEVAAVGAPVSTEEVQEAIRRSRGAISVGGGRFSMGGQTASPASLHLDMRRLNRVIRLEPIARRVRVQAGIRWCDLQRFLDAHDLSVKIMQTYANFTVGGSLSVNVHGRYVGQGPLILSVESIAIVLASGELVEASPSQRPEVFYGAIGGYGALGVIVEATLGLAENDRVERVHERMERASYLEFFRQKVRDNQDAVFHNADLYPPHYERLRAVSWVKTDDYVTNPRRLMRVEPLHTFWRYFFWAVSETPFGAWRREHILEPLAYLGKVVHWRNYEAGYDVYELEPATRKWKTYVLQEYFVPLERFEDFTQRMAEIFNRYQVNVLNVSIRHAHVDPGSYLAWAREEVFAFVVYYKQETSERARNCVATWTRELIQAAIDVGGSYYLPYQPHATPEQFHAAFPRARELFALKGELDPEFRFRNVIWDTYYAPTLEPSAPSDDPGATLAAARPRAADTGAAIPADAPPTALGRPPVRSEFHAVFDDTVWRDRFYLFLQNIYRLYPEDGFHQLIVEACAAHESDEVIYRTLQARLPEIEPFLAPLRYALPSLKKQKAEMTQQTLGLLGSRRKISGYLEIGSTGRYISSLRKHLDLSGPLLLVNDVAPSSSLEDMFERGQREPLGDFLPLNDYAPLPGSIGDESLDLVTCYIGLHHCPLENLDGFVRSIVRVLRPGGLFVLRDHDAGAPEMKTFVSLVHTVFNAGLGAPWKTDREEKRFFVGVEEYVAYLAARGLADQGHRIRQANDPSDNLLMAFVKSADAADASEEERS